MKNILVGLLTFSSVSFAIANEMQGPQKIVIEVTEQGFVPSSISVKPGTNIVLEITRKTDSTCSTEIQIPSKKIKKTNLPLNEKVTIALGKVKTGEIKFGCGMNMMDSGKILVQ